MRSLAFVVGLLALLFTPNGAHAQPGASAVSSVSVFAGVGAGGVSIDSPASNYSVSSYSLQFDLARRVGPRFMYGLHLAMSYGSFSEDDFRAMFDSSTSEAFLPVQAGPLLEWMLSDTFLVGGWAGIQPIFSSVDNIFYDYRHNATTATQHGLEHLTTQLAGGLKGSIEIPLHGIHHLSVFVDSSFGFTGPSSTSIIGGIGYRTW
jgi:hypothetical protein